jgi:hypothetical protein
MHLQLDYLTAKRVKYNAELSLIYIKMAEILKHNHH